MSTKATIFSNNTLHVYEEVFEENNIFIEIESFKKLKVSISNNNSKVTVSFSKKEFENISKKYLQWVKENKDEHFNT